jgi:Transposase DDE domain group 1
MPQDTPRLPFEIDDTIDPTVVTGRAGVPLVFELFRQLGVAQTLDAKVAVKQRQRGLPPSQLIESLIALWVSGGDRCQDLAMLREDQALAALLGHPLPAATTVRDFLEAFHVEGGPLWAAGPAATIPLESAPLAGLGQANRTLVAGLQRGARETTATLDVDATLVESHKEAATVAYDGTRGYQPVLVLWAEQDVIVHDQFRDGHVPAGCGNLRVLQQAVANLPQGLTQIAVRADSALYETDVLQWCEDEQIAYAISADMSDQLRAEIVRLPEAAWEVEREEPDALRAWAEVAVRPERWVACPH